MNVNNLVLRVVDALEANKVPYMVVGSFASNTYGVERSTNDADFVIELEDRPITAIANALSPDLVLDPQLMLETVTLSYRYVLKHVGTGFKIELFMRGDDPFQLERFRRRVQRPFLDRNAWLPTPEDVIVQKLRWFGRAKRPKDWSDARNVTAVQLARLDLPYIRYWCDQHGTRELFETLLSEAESLQ